MQNWFLLLLFLGSFYFGKSQVLQTKTIPNSENSLPIYLNTPLPCFKVHLFDLSFYANEHFACEASLFKKEVNNGK